MDGGETQAERERGRPSYSEYTTGCDLIRCLPLSGGASLAPGALGGVQCRPLERLLCHVLWDSRNFDV